MSINSKNQGLIDSGQDFKFDVFISYRHSELDSAAAAYLHKALENYKIPREIQQKIGKKRINRVFRDEEELGASSDLFGEIENSIKSSEYLVVVLSPRYKQSKWCIKEIEAFLKYRSRDNILAVIIEGEPYDVFPDILMEDGEPLALDLRAKDKKEMLKLAKERLPRLIAPILGCTYDELYQRHRIARMRRIAMMACVVATISLIFGAITINQAIQINKNLISKQENQSRYLARISDELLKAGDRESAILVAMEALPEDSEDTSRPYVAEARIALENALYTYNLDLLYNLRPMKIMEMDTECAYTTKGDYHRDEDVMASVDTMGHVYIWDCRTANLVNKITDYKAEDIRFAGKQRILIKTEGGVYCLNYTNSSLLWQWTMPLDVEYSSYLTYAFEWAYNPETDTVICINEDLEWDQESYLNAQLKREYNYFVADNHKVHIIDVTTGNATTWIPEEVFMNIDREAWEKNTVLNMSVSPDGKHVAFKLYSGSVLLDSIGQHDIYVYPITGGLPVFQYTVQACPALNELYWYDDETLISVYSQDDVNDALRIYAKRFKWTVDCYNISSGKKLWSMDESAISIDLSFDIQTFDWQQDNNVYSYIGITAGNVFVCIDPENGTVYSRLEDRSPFVLVQQVTDGKKMLFMTQDGYVFASDLLEDTIWLSDVTALSYYMNISDISHVLRYNGKTYIFSGSSIHWCQPDGDFSFTYTDPGMLSAGFSDNGQYIWLKSDVAEAFGETQYKISLYDTISNDWIVEDDMAQCLYSDNDAVIVKNRYLVYPSLEPATVSVYDIETDKTLFYPVTDMHQDRYELCIGAINTQHTLVPVYLGDMLSLRDLERITGNIVRIKDITTGEDLVALQFKDIVQALGCDETARYLFIKSAYMSGDCNYLLISCLLSRQDAEKNDLPDEMHILVWDIESACWRALPQDVDDSLITTSYYYTQDGWIMPGTSLINTYGTDGSIRIIDLNGTKVLHKLDFGQVGSNEISFTPDGDHLILQDNSYHLKVYNWRKGIYTTDKTIPESAQMEFEFYDDGKIMTTREINGVVLTDIVRIYEPIKPGLYQLQTRIGMCEACDGKSTIIADGDNSRIYSYYTFDKLTEMAREIVGDRQLTDAERQTYLID